MAAFLTATLCAAPASAGASYTPEEQQTLDTVRAAHQLAETERHTLRDTYEREEQACYEKILVNQCRNEARANYTRQIQEVRMRENANFAEERRIRQQAQRRREQEQAAQSAADSAALPDRAAAVIEERARRSEKITAARARKEDEARNGATKRQEQLRKQAERAAQHEREVAEKKTAAERRTADQKSRELAAPATAPAN